MGHYLLNIEFSVVIEAMYHRFFARNAISKIANIKGLIKGYISSYKYLIALISILLFSICLLKKYRQSFFKLLKEYAYPLIFFTIIILENLLLMQHATEYSFDRLKIIFLLIILVFIIIITVNNQNKDDKFFATYILVFITCIAALNSYNYLHKNEYISNFKYTAKNNLIADYIKANYNYENSILTSPYFVRGYLNLLFDRGIYELVQYNSADYNELKELAIAKNKQYLLSIDCISTEKSQITNVYVSDLKNKKEYKLNTNKSDITLEEIK